MFRPQLSTYNGIGLNVSTRKFGTWPTEEEAVVTPLKEKHLILCL